MLRVAPFAALLLFAAAPGAAKPMEAVVLTFPVGGFRSNTTATVPRLANSSTTAPLQFELAGGPLEHGVTARQAQAFSGSEAHEHRLSTQDLPEVMEPVDAGQGDASRGGGGRISSRVSRQAALLAVASAIVTAVTWDHLQAEKDDGDGSGESSTCCDLL